MANGESLASVKDSWARGEEKTEDEDQPQVGSNIAEDTDEYQKNMIILLFLFHSTPSGHILGNSIFLRELITCLTVSDIL